MLGNGGILVLALALPACAHVPAPGPMRYVVSHVASRCEAGDEDQSLVVQSLQERKELLDGLPRPEQAGTKQELLDAVSREDDRALVIFYSGHGTDRASENLPRKSALCFEDGRLLVDDLLAAINPRVRSATVVLDACFSGRVDVRRSAVPVAVLSAADKPISSTGTGTAMGASLAVALRDGDANRDGVVDDGELLAAIIAGMATAPRFEPRLRRQSFSALPVIVEASRNRAQPDWLLNSAVDGSVRQRLVARELAFRSLRLERIAREPSVFWAWSSESPSLAALRTASRLNGAPSELEAFAQRLSASEGFLLTPHDDEVAVISLRNGIERATIPGGALQTFVQRFEEGGWAKLAEDGQSFWTSGYLAQSILASDSGKIDGTRARAVPCGEPFGQCFELLGEARRP